MVYNISMAELEKIMKALANKRRLAILACLKKKKELPVTHVADEIKLSIKATSKHLAILQSVGILEREQRWLEAFYSLNANMPKPAKHIISIL